MLNAALCAAGIGSRRIEQPAKAAQKELFEYNGNGWTVCLCALSVGISWGYSPDVQVLFTGRPRMQKLL